MKTPREDDLRQRELELKERELEIRLRELDAEVQKSSTKAPEVQQASDYVDADLEDARLGRSWRRRWRSLVTICKFLGLFVLSIVAVSLVFQVGIVVIFFSLAYTVFQIFFVKEK
ncbi:MAG: hypothetical protein GFH24_608378n20 [Chloroflexi bacterium AL-N5]|nr:hypothetical protein [Chloroflexi bacterium AL-N5]